MPRPALQTKMSPLSRDESRRLQFFFSADQLRVYKNLFVHLYFRLLVNEPTESRRRSFALFWAANKPLADDSDARRSQSALNQNKGNFIVPSASELVVVVD